MKQKWPFYLHAYARGIEKQPIFRNPIDYSRFFLATTLSLLPNAPGMSTFLNLINKKVLSPSNLTFPMLKQLYGQPILNILSATLMPNHFHFHIQFFSKVNRTQFFRRLIDSYTKYFNTRYEREGHLFSSTVKAVSIITDEQNLYLTKYIHLNPTKSSQTQISPTTLSQYPWSTYNHYLGRPSTFTIKNNIYFDTSYFCDPKPILDQFSSAKSYREFVLGEKSEDDPEILSQKELIDQSE